ncbi:MAG: 50S ribosomal protein L19 [Planctomycetota bacterium]
MAQPLMELVEKAYLKSKSPTFGIGDTVDVLTRIVEGEKERVQTFNGTVIARRGRGTNLSFTVRRIVGNEGVERTFLVHSPNVVDVKVKRHGRVRRAKLYFLRQRVGKARKLREKRVSARITPEAEAAGSPAGVA